MVVDAEWNPMYKPVKKCDSCEGGLFEGDEYFDIDGSVLDLCEKILQAQPAAKLSCHAGPAVVHCGLRSCDLADLIPDKGIMGAA